MAENQEKIRLVVDTNILMSAMLKDNSLTIRLLKSGFLDLYYLEDGLTEIEHYKKYIISKRKRSLKKQSFEYLLKFIMESVNIISSKLYSGSMKKAYEVMKDLDEKDTPFLALALQLNYPIWSNDKHFKKQNSVKAYATDNIIELLKRHKRTGFIN